MPAIAPNMAVPNQKRLMTVTQTRYTMPSAKKLRMPAADDKLWYELSRICRKNEYSASGSYMCFVSILHNNIMSVMSSSANATHRYAPYENFGRLAHVW